MIDTIIRSKSPSEALALLRSQGAGDVYTELKARQDLINPQRHKVNDPSYRKDKFTLVDFDPNDPSMMLSLGAECSVHTDEYGERKALRVDKVNRIALALQKRIINAAVAFTFGNPVIYNASPENEAEKVLFTRFTQALREARMLSHDRKLAKHLFTYAEVAELWFVTPGQDGERSKLRSRLLSPGLGDRLYPYFDEYGDLLAFTRGYTSTDAEGKEQQYHDCYTARAIYRFRGDELEAGYPKPNPLGKIPVIYTRQSTHETADVDSLIERLETLLSNFSDTNDYHASPKIFVTGELQGFSKRGEAGAIIEGAEGAKAEYLSWASAPEAVRLEIDTLLKMIYTISQTPDISFDSVKGLGAMSGTALKLLFMDAHLKVQDKRELLDEYLSRRVSLLLRFLVELDATLLGASRTLDIEPEISPYTITSDAEDLDYWMKASGNKPLLSHEEAIARAGLSHDAEATLRSLQAEAEASVRIFASEPTSAGV